MLGLPKLPGRITRAALVNGAKVKYNENSLGVMLKVPLAGRDPLDTVVVLELQ